MKTFVLLPLMLVAPSALAQTVVPVVLYQPGRTILSQQITLRGWGSGTIAETDEVAFEGRTSVRVATRNYFQGGIMTLGEPKDLAEKFDDRSNLLRITFLMADSALVLQSSGVGGTRSGRERDLAGTGGGAMGLIVTRAQHRIRVIPPLITKVDSLRLIVTTTDGKKSELYVPVNSSSGVDEHGWRSLAVPLHAIHGFDRTNKIVKEFAMSADTVTTFYVGDIRIVNDTTPIKGEVNVDKLNLALGDEVQLQASGDGGASVLVYQWDFDASDGVQVDSEGPVIKRKFRKAGQFKVTLTISDLYGLKAPFTTSFPVRVNP